MLATGGSVFLSIPASCSARLFAQETSGSSVRQKPQMQRTRTGLPPAGLSRSWRSGQRPSASVSGRLSR
jgi:hypothetical protein